MSKINTDVLNDSIHRVLEGSQTRKRKFLETVELQFNLKNYDTQKDKRFNGSIRYGSPSPQNWGALVQSVNLNTLRYIPKQNFKVCLLGDQQHCDEADELGVPHRSHDDLKKLNRNKKVIKKLVKSYDAFLASDKLIKFIPKLLGPSLNKMGKFPISVAHSDAMVDKVSALKSTVKFQMKKVLTLAVPIGNVSMTEEELLVNITMAINFLVSLLKKKWQNIKSIHIKSTMGKPQRLI
ncbi:hypothetical protein A3Q56_01345 [Intoshia linei]|uniref:Large ribosomal subunit protein uL1 n=1 Tax=Intoshia linei TaxID=1819745 RepID=A0A177B9J2_9BILA|nr:hypothetical protein A3Q56_01345 [Intoshia linei]